MGIFFKKKFKLPKKPPIISLLTPVWPDRDDFIEIHEENILPEMKQNFVKRPYGDAEFGVKGSVDTEHSPYDAVSAQKFWEKRLFGSFFCFQTMAFWSWNLQKLGSVHVPDIHGA